MKFTLELDNVWWSNDIRAVGSILASIVYHRTWTGRGGGGIIHKFPEMNSKQAMYS